MNIRRFESLTALTQAAQEAAEKRSSSAPRMTSQEEMEAMERVLLRCSDIVQKILDETSINLVGLHTDASLDTGEIALDIAEAVVQTPALALQKPLNQAVEMLVEAADDLERSGKKPDPNTTRYVQQALRLALLHVSHPQ